MLIDFGSRHHPVGGLALHKTLGIVQIDDTDGAFKRLVSYFDWDDGGKTVMMGEWVHVRQLSEANLLKDIELVLG